MKRINKKDKSTFKNSFRTFIRVLTIGLVILSPILIFFYILYLIVSINKILNIAPNSNLALLVEILTNFWKEALAISLGISGIFLITSFSVLFLLIKKLKKEIYKKELMKILKLFILLYVSSFLFVILMAATKPEDSSFTLTFLPYIGSILLFGYTVFFKNDN
ncbi:hypothetical protein [Staphylococcus saprophyticus]|uniref:hypothetical protein n=1 Tax=Staphylococcus saprophyticus TaxID=29385 RepID=UPI0022EAAB08|nr:hypothetical protein [Staphylococcus saprophyticus]